MTDAESVVTDWTDAIDRNLVRDSKTGREYYAAYGEAIGSGLFDWELFFDSIVLSYFGREEYAINGFHIFLADQKRNGFIRRHVVNDEETPIRDRSANGRRSNPRNTASRFSSRLR